MNATSSDFKVFITRRLPGLRGRTIVFLEEEDASVVAEIPGIKDAPVFIAAKCQDRLPEQAGQALRDKIFCYTAPDFVDRVKVLTGGKGFENAVVQSSDPKAFKLALGVSSVLGDIYFLVPPSDKVSVDLTATINFKSLRVHGPGQG